MFSKLKNAAHVGDTSDTAAGDRDQSLGTLLPSPEQRTDLLLLVANSTEAMRLRILDVFDPDKTGDASLKLKSLPPPPSDSLGTASEVIATKEDENAEEKVEHKNDGETESQRSDAGEVRKRRERRAKELSGPAMTNLKKAALDHFDEWRDRVISRVGEVINQQDADKELVSTDEGKKRASERIQFMEEAPGLTREDTEDDVALHQLYPPHQTNLKDLDRPRRVLILHSLLLLLLSLESYPAESRVLMLHLTSSLSLPVEILEVDESRVAQGLLEAAKQQMNADQETKDKAKSNVMSRNLKVGVGAVAGAVLIGVTGGLAAPLLAAGVGTVMGGLGLGATATAGLLGSLAGSAPLVGILFGAYGGKMTGEMVDEYAKEVQDFAFIPIRKQRLLSFGKAKHSDKNCHHLRVSIGLSGYLTEESEVVSPWQIGGNANAEAFALRWELKTLIALGHALTTYIKSYAWGFAKKEILSRTIFAAVASAVTLPYAIAKASRVVDNPFSVARSKSEKAGKVLADALIHKVQGERPVTLMGYSLGARVIFYCLKELADRRAFGIVENVILIGAATPSDSSDWRSICSMVSGRVVNVYSTKDYLLGYLYRTSSLQYGIAGLKPIQDVEGVENVDVSDLVHGHTKYRFFTGKILQRVGWEDIDEEAVQKQMEKLGREEKKEKEEEESKGQTGAEAEAERTEKEIEEQSRGSQAMDWMSNKMSGLKVSK